MAHRTTHQSNNVPPTSSLSEPGLSYPWRQAQQQPPPQPHPPQQQYQQQQQPQQYQQIGQQPQQYQQAGQQQQAPWRQQPQQQQQPTTYNNAPQQQQQYQSSTQFTPSQPQQQTTPTSASNATPWRTQQPQQQQQPQQSKGPMVHQTPQSHQIHLLAGETENYAKPDPNMAPSSTRPIKQFAPAQIARYRRVFDMFDINKDGVLEARELAAVSQIMGYRMPRGQVMGILSHVDLDTNGVLTFEEFLQAMPGNVQNISKQEHENAELRFRFQEFDKDCNGVITKDEAHQVLQKELGFTPHQTIAFVNKFDINADGMLSYEEFVEFYSKVKERKEAIDKAFCQFDKDGKGFVSLSDAKRILGGLLFSETEVEALVNAHDTNKDGKLQYDEFMHFWTA